MAFTSTYLPMRNLSIIGAAACSAMLLSGCATSGGVTKADKRFEQGEYQPAIELYKADVAKGKNAPMANFRIGESLRLSNRLDQAEPYYKAALDGGVKNADAGYRYAQALKANGKLDEASAQFNTYAQGGGNSTLTTQAQAEAQSASASKALIGKAAAYDVAPLDALNSPDADFSTSRLPSSGELVFASGRDGKTFQGNGGKFLSLYAQKFDDPTAMTGGTTRKLEAQFNNANELQASATYTPDGTTMVFARSNDGSKKGTKSVDLWISYFRNGAWSVPELANINDSATDDFAPAFAPDGKTLYFSSARQGGVGGNDLYKATLDANGHFTTPENLGPAVNTAGNENFPGIATDGTLYFSSDWHPGYGKLDVFKYENGQVVNLGPAINSAGDDFAPFFTGPGMGVFSSNREGGKGSDDLYSFKKKPRPVVTYTLDGTVQAFDSETNSTTPLEGETVTITSPNGRKQDVTAGPGGKFSAKLDSAQTYQLFADRDQHFIARATASTEGRYPTSLTQLQNDIKIPVTLTLNKINKKPIVVRDIFYDYNKFNIRADAAVRLDTLVQTLRDNPKIHIELSSHTDQRGKDAYNLKLSQKRAESAVAYLVSKGIIKSRLTAKGYGETQPIIANPKSEADYQRNRRTEFKVTSVDK